MLLKGRFQLPDFFPQSLALCNAAFKSGSKIPLILHGSGLYNKGSNSGMVWVDYRKPFEAGNFTKYRICGDKMIHQLLIPQFQCDCQLKSVQGTKTRGKRITLNQQLGRSKLRFPDRENLQFPGRGIFPKLTQE